MVMALPWMSRLRSSGGGVAGAEEVDWCVYVGGGIDGGAGGTPAVPAATPAVPAAGFRRGLRRVGGVDGTVGEGAGAGAGAGAEGTGGTGFAGGGVVGVVGGFVLKAMTHSATSDTDEYSRTPVGVL